MYAQLLFEQLFYIRNSEKLPNLFRNLVHNFN